MGPPPSEEQMADMLSDPAVVQTLNEALQNPQMVDLMIQSNPTLRAMGPQARLLLQSPGFRQMLMSPDALRQAAQVRRFLSGGAGGFPAPGVTDTTPQGAAGTAGTPNQPNATLINPFGLFAPAAGARPFNPFDPSAAAGNPFLALLNPQAGTPGHTPAQSPPPPSSAGQATSTSERDASQPPPNPFASLFAPPAGVGANPFGNMTPEMMQQAMALLQGGGLGDFGGFGTPPPPPPVDNRPPEELYADQLRQLNDMGFFDFERNVQALRRSGGSVQGAINQLLG